MHISRVNVFIIGMASLTTVAKDANNIIQDDDHVRVCIRMLMASCNMTTIYMCTSKC